jgi:hypothetical protein
MSTPTQSRMTRMGVYNASAALRVAPYKLNGSARWTLLAMALMTLDAPTERSAARLYYGGWQLVCIRKGLLPTDDERKRFTRDIATLRRLALVEVVEPGYRGHAAVYRLLLPVDKSQDSVDNAE